jgi:hypothetical protein
MAWVAQSMNLRDLQYLIALCRKLPRQVDSSKACE